MEIGTKLTFLAIIMYAAAVATASIAFTPIGGLLVGVMIIVTLKSVK